MKKMRWNEAQDFMNSNENVFLMFTTSWCGDCQMMKPFIEKIESDMNGKNITFIEVNAEEAGIFRNSGKWDASKVPSYFVVKNGEPKHIGFEFMPAEVLKAYAESLI